MLQRITSLLFNMSPPAEVVDCTREFRRQMEAKLGYDKACAVADADYNPCYVYLVANHPAYAGELGASFRTLQDVIEAFGGDVPTSGWTSRYLDEHMRLVFFDLNDELDTRDYLHFIHHNPDFSPNEIRKVFQELPPAQRWYWIKHFGAECERARDADYNRFKTRASCQKYWADWLKANNIRIK
jgi:hypothetical protein